jgi:Zn-dependent protease
MFAEDWLLNRMMFWIPLVLSLTVHEWAHAWSAFRLGDATAASEGRLTLNPLAHMDPIGTLLLPMLIPFGWAKPVPINIGRFHPQVSMRAGVLLTAAAGPVSNLCIALLSVLVLLTTTYVCGDVARIPGSLHWLLETLIWLNVLLATFNMLPFPPLDGSRIADALMPDRFRSLWDSFCQLGPVALLVVILLPILSGCHILLWPIEVTQQTVDMLIQQVTS